MPYAVQLQNFKCYLLRNNIDMHSYILYNMYIYVFVCMYIDAFLCCYRVLIAFVCLWHPVFSTILRLPCFTQADFKIFEIDKRLEGNVFSKHYDTSDVQCTVLCVENRKCRSYNIHVAKMICELNSKALIDNGTKLTDDMGWVYKSTNYSGLYVCSTFYLFIY